MQRRHHYETAFESHLRARRIPYVAVDEARKALLPDPRAIAWSRGDDESAKLKSFDFVLYGQDNNLLCEVKGRRVGARKINPRRNIVRLVDEPLLFRPPSTRLESWVTREDVESLLRWEALFGSGFEAAFVFVYWCADQPPDALFAETFAHHDRWYAVRVAPVRAYRKVMKTRSEKWGTVDVPRREFEAISAPLALDRAGGEPWASAFPAMSALGSGV